MRRIGTGFGVLLGVTVITFTLAHSLSFNPLVAWLGKTALFNPGLAALYDRTYHLNDPLYIQFFYYINGLLHLQLGFSFTKDELVSQAISQTLPITLQLVVLSVVITILLSLAGALLSASFAGRLPDKVTRLLYMLGQGSPPFLIALLFVVVFSYVIPILPSGGLIGLTIQLPRPITGFPLIDALLEGKLQAFGSLIQHLILPSVALAITNYGMMTRILRSSLIEKLGSNFVRAAKARGVSSSQVLYRYAFKNSLIELVTLSSLVFTFTLIGDLFVEQIFSYPGMGRYALQTALAFDYAGLFGVTLVYAVFVVAVNLSADILYAAVDPRVRL